MKQGLVQDSAIEHVGEIVRIDCGLTAQILSPFISKPLTRISNSDLKTLVLPNPKIESNKYQRGRVLVIAGSQKYKGAALLSLKGAIASGVGCIYASLPQLVGDNLWQVSPEIVLANCLHSDPNGESLLLDLLSNQELNNIDALLIGPGLGGGVEENWDLVGEKLLNFMGLLVLDADAINRLSGSSKGWRWLKDRMGPTWLTPHLSEFNRLFPGLQDSSPVEAVKEASAISGTSIVLKGAHSLVSVPSGKSWQVVGTFPHAARFGFGDLLAGYAAGLGAIGLASGNDLPEYLLASACFLHAQAARRCKKGSSASAISKTLEKMTRKIQSKKENIGT